MPAPKVAIAPERAREWLADAVRAGGGEVVEPAAAEALVWAEPAAPEQLTALLAGEAAGVRWVQLPWAGVEPYVDVIDTERTWTCAKGVYADPVAEHAVALLLAGLRQVGFFARQSQWTRGRGVNLLGARVVVVGGGGIARSLVRQLGGFGCDVTIVRRRPEPFDGARVVGADQLVDVIPGAAAVILALALTPATVGLVDASVLEAMDAEAWLVNVARGRHVVTDDLVAALAREAIGGAALDVTDPEPLPEGHPLWSSPRSIITPHTANTIEMAAPLLGRLITGNVRRFAEGQPLDGIVDPELGY